MTLRLITASGTLELGDPPPTHDACVFCGAAAQIAAAGATGDVMACAGCTQDAIITAALLADTPGAAPIGDDGCARIQAWADRRRRVSGLARAVVDSCQPIGRPRLGDDEVRLHPDDMAALQRWADRQPPPR